MSSFRAKGLIDNGHTIGQMEDIMDTLHITSKGKMMGGLGEILHLPQNENKQSNQ